MIPQNEYERHLAIIYESIITFVIVFAIVAAVVQKRWYCLPVFFCALAIIALTWYFYFFLCNRINFLVSLIGKLSYLTARKL